MEESYIALDCMAAFLREGNSDLKPAFTNGFTSGVERFINYYYYLKVYLYSKELNFVFSERKC
jgi:hypothetical protein